MVQVLIPGRFNGPPRSANGGYAAGAIAEAVRRDLGWAGDVTVRLLRPPPLDIPLALVPAGDRGEAVEVRPADGDPVAVASSHGPDAWTATQPVPAELARTAQDGYPGLRAHPFPTCFSCGPDRQEGDGLRIFPGRLPDGRVAATWTPDPSLAAEDGAVGTAVTWAALDCVGGWSSDLEHRPLVLAQMCAQVESRPQVGTTYSVVGTFHRSDGRKTWTASALFDGDRQVGRAEQLWIAVDWAVVQHLQEG